ncbi:MAG: hypothetical protein ABI599_05725 [Flavobacteriales bacterium]
MSKSAFCAGLLLLMGSLEATAQLPDWLWARNANMDGTGLVEQTATDAAGNVFVCGYFDNNATMGSFPLAAVGGFDAYVAKLDPSGNWLWATSFGSTGADDALAIAVDGDGNAYLTGFHEGDITVGDTTLAVEGGSDLFIAKIDGSGNWIWALDAAGLGYSAGSDVVLGPNGSLYVGGSVDSDGEVFGEDTIPSGGLSGSLVMRLDIDGNWQWVHVIEHSGVTSMNGMAYSTGEGIVVVGAFSGTLYAGGDTLISGISEKAFIAVVDTMGVDQWSWRTSGSSVTVASDVMVDAFGRIFLVGYASTGTAIVGDSTFVVTDANDALVVRVSPNGFWDWSRRSTGTGNEVIEDLAALPDGQIVVVGTYRDGDLQLGSLASTNTGGADAFIAAVSTTGNWLLVKQGSGIGDEYCHTVAISYLGHIYVGGSYAGVATFGLDMLTSTGAQDAYVAKIGVIGTTVQSTDPASFAPVLVQDGAGSVLHGLSDGIASVRVTDASGRIVFQRTGRATGGRLALGGVDLSVGAFLIQVQQGEQHATLKFVAR